MTITELEDYFKQAKLPVGPFFLNPSTKINDAQHFLESHFGPLKANGETFINAPLKDRLLEFKAFLEKQT